MTDSLSAQDIETGRLVYLGKLKAAASEGDWVNLTPQHVRELAAILEALGPSKDTRPLGIYGPDADR